LEFSPHHLFADEIGLPPIVFRRMRPSHETGNLRIVTRFSRSEAPGGRTWVQAVTVYRVTILNAMWRGRLLSYACTATAYFYERARNRL
jgi:hypothetical protein